MIIEYHSVDDIIVKRINIKIMQSLRHTASNRKRKTFVAIVCVIVIILLAAATYYYLKQKDESYRAKQYGSSQTNPGKDTPIASGNNHTGSASNSRGASNAPATSSDSSVTPTVPTGTFVSNHHPNLSGQPAPNLESSTCTTTPGVACQIKFTSGDVVKVLEPQTTNEDGNTSWTWRLGDIGLTVGEWKVTAVATNGSKVTMADDSMLLSIKQ